MEIPTDQQRRGERLLRDNPALAKSNWLPEGTFPELTELRERHVKLLEDRAVASRACTSLREKYEAEDEAQQRSFQNGGKAPRLTPEAERADAKREAESRLRAANIALAEFIDEAVVAIQAQESAWIELLKQRAVAADEKVEEAKRLLDEAHRDRWAIKRVRMWVERTSENKQARHVAYEQLAGPPPPRGIELPTGMTGAAVEEYAGSPA